MRFMCGGGTPLAGVALWQQGGALQCVKRALGLSEGWAGCGAGRLLRLGDTLGPVEHQPEAGAHVRDADEDDERDGGGDGDRRHDRAKGLALQWVEGDARGGCQSTKPNSIMWHIMLPMIASPGLLGEASGHSALGPTSSQPSETRISVAPSTEEKQGKEAR